MPISITPSATFTIDKVRIDEFAVRPQNKTVIIHFSRGYEDAEGNFIPKEFDRVDVKNVDFDPTLYSQVKDTLYSLLTTTLVEQSTANAEQKK